MRRQDSLATLNHLFFYNVEQFRRERLLTLAEPGGRLIYSSRQFMQVVFSLRCFLLESGLTEGDRVAILAENRPEWHIADFAILLARLVVVPIYTSLSASQVRNVLEHSQSRAVIVSGSKQWELLRPLLADLPDVQCTIACDCGESEHSATATFSEIVARTPAAAKSDWASMRAEALSVSPEATATIVYTSGTTGRPKGVMLSHGNIMFDLERCLERLQFRTPRQALSVLPLAHVFERLLCYGYFRLGIPVAYGDPHSLRELLRQHKPAVMGCVPRILEKMRDAVEGQVRAQPPRKQAIFRSLLEAGLACTRRTGFRERVGLKHRLLHPVAEAVLFARIRRQFGGLRDIVCGGASLNASVEDFFRALGFNVLQGYGLTESSPVISLSAPGRERSGSVGTPLDGVQVTISDEGEILTRGPHVMKGYFRDPEATAKALREGGWLRTGDLGSLDSENNLRITGRQNDLLVLSTGKNASPFFAEEALRRSRLVQEVFVVGHGRRFLTALIVPHRSNLEAAAIHIPVSSTSFEELLAEREILRLFQGELESLQADLAPFEQVKRFCFLSEQVLLDPALVTPTQKIRRTVLELRYAANIDKMYSREEPPVAFLAPMPDEAANAAAG